MGEEKITITKEDFCWLGNFFYTCGPWFCRRQSDLMLFQFVCVRTIRFCKFSEKIPVAHFRFGVPNTFPPVLGFPNWGSGSLSRSRSRLINLNVLSVAGVAKGRTPVYTINIPGILAVCCNFDPANVKLVSLQQKFDGCFVENGWLFSGPVKCRRDILDKLELHACAKNGGGHMRIEEAVEMGKVKGDASLKKQQAKKLSNLACHPAAVFSAMKDYCKQDGIPYREYPTGKLKGCAKNWVKEFVGYDEADRMSALEFLYLICDKWAIIRSALGVAGHPQISERVNFEEYYEFRRHINDYMAGGSIRSKFGGGKKVLSQCPIEFELTNIGDLKV